MLGVLCPGTEKDVVQTHCCTRSNLLSISCSPSCLLYHRGTSGKLSAGTVKILFTPVPVPRNGVQVLPFKVVPMPVHSTEIFAWTPTNVNVRLVPKSKNRIPGAKSEWGLSLCYCLCFLNRLCNIQC